MVLGYINDENETVKFNRCSPVSILDWASNAGTLMYLAFTTENPQSASNVLHVAQHIDDGTTVSSLCNQLSYFSLD